MLRFFETQCSGLAGPPPVSPPRPPSVNPPSPTRPAALSQQLNCSISERVIFSKSLKFEDAGSIVYV